MKSIKYVLLIICSLFLTACFEAPTLVSISVIDIPEKIEIGKFDDADIKLVLSYDNETTETIKLTESLIPEEKKQF